MGSIHQARVRRLGFTLIELLVVIAIIALLAAIIFPVFEQIKENSRQSTSISNMHDISTKLEQYNLDAHHYPPVLFGYAVPTGPKAYASMDQALNTCTVQQTCSTYLTGLYPEYR
jgi:prepilin-type N-terminal cleavage/methylation domain-containing protein